MRLKLKAQLLCGGEDAGEIAMGPGKAELLAAIEREASITRAARAMDMSYRRAWLLVDTMNRCWAQPLVATTPGGGAGAGARLTDAGREVLALYRTLEREMERGVAPDTRAGLEALLREVPLAR